MKKRYIPLLVVFVFGVIVAVTMPNEKVIITWPIFWALLALSSIGCYEVVDYCFKVIEGIKDKTFTKKHDTMIKVDDQRFASVTDAKIYIRVKYEGWNDDRIR